MKFFLAILLAALTCSAPSWGQSTGDVQLGVKSSTGPLEPVWITKTANRALGWNESGVLGTVTISGGSGSSAWADITGKPTTLAGYGIVDSITAALAASTYQPLIGTGTLALSKLATDPLARANHTGTQAWSTITSTPTTLAGYGITDSITAALAASTYQPLIGTGTLALSKLATDPLARANHTGTQAWSTITSTPTTLAGYGIVDSITAALAASTYQPLTSNLTTYSGITPSANVQTLLGAANYAAFKASLSLGNVENTALSTWTGSTSIVTLGTISIGTWQGNSIDEAYISSAAIWNAKESALTFSTGLTRTTNTITVDSTQNISRLSNFTSNGFVKTSGSDGTLSVDTNTYITGSTSIGGNGGADGGKVVKFNGYGGLNTSTDLNFYAVGGATTAITVPDSVTSYTVTLPQANGTLALTDDVSLANLSGLGTGVATALAINAGSAGAPVLFNGAGGTPTSITLTNGTALPVSGITSSTSTALGLGSIELGHASDTTIARSSAGNLTVEGQNIYRAGGSFTGMPVEIVIACSDETTALTTGTANVTFRMPHAMTLSSIRLNVNTAPTGSVIIVDVKEAGTTLFSTKPQIATSAFTSVGGAVPGTLSDTSLADDAEITINLDQIGSTIAGKGLKVTLIGTRQ